MEWKQDKQNQQIHKLIDFIATPTTESLFQRKNEQGKKQQIHKSIILLRPEQRPCFKGKMTRERKTKSTGRWDFIANATEALFQTEKMVRKDATRLLLQRAERNTSLVAKSNAHAASDRSET